MTWKNERYRHKLAARGVKTKQTPTCFKGLTNREKANIYTAYEKVDCFLNALKDRWHWSCFNITNIEGYTDEELEDYHGHSINEIAKNFDWYSSLENLSQYIKLASQLLPGHHYEANDHILYADLTPDMKRLVEKEVPGIEIRPRSAL